MKFINKAFESEPRVLNLKVRYYRWFPAEAHQGFVMENLKINLQETAFLLIDVYCSGLHTEHSESKDAYSKKWHQITVNQIAPALFTARQIGLPIIYVNNSAPKVDLQKSEFAEKLRKSLGFDMTNDFVEAEIDSKEYLKGKPIQLNFPPEIYPQPTDYFIRKHFYSGFFETRLDTLLRNLKIRNLICVGFVADACLFTTIADAVFRNYKVILLRDCTLASEFPREVEELKNTQRTILWIETIFGVSLTSEEFIQACQNQIL